MEKKLKKKNCSHHLQALLCQWTGGGKKKAHLTEERKNPGRSKIRDVQPSASAAQSEGVHGKEGRSERGGGVGRCRGMRVVLPVLSQIILEQLWRFTLGLEVTGKVVNILYYCIKNLFDFGLGLNGP